MYWRTRTPPTSPAEPNVAPWTNLALQPDQLAYRSNHHQYYRVGDKEAKTIRQVMRSTRQIPIDDFELVLANYQRRKVLRIQTSLRKFRTKKPSADHHRRVTERIGARPEEIPPWGDSGQPQLVAQLWGRPRVSILAAIVAAILDFSTILFLAKLQETFDWNLKYCVLNNSVICVNNSLVMFFVTSRYKR